MTQQYAITIENLQLHYQGKVLFSHLNAQFALNQWTSIVGPSGIGKSSLLRYIAGLNTGGITSGKLHITDNRSIGYVSQQDNLLPWLSAFNNTLIGFRLRNNLSPEKKEQAIQLFEQFNLLDSMHKKPHELSGGMRQRVSLIRALLENNSILLLDEPFSALDVITRLKLQEFAFKLLQNKTVIMVTHDPLEALRLSHHLMILKGEPIQLSSPIQFSTPPLREVDAPEILLHQAQLYRELM